MIASTVAHWGAITLSTIREMGRMVVFLAQTITWLVRPPFRIHQLLKQMHFIGVKSLFVIVLTGAFTGMVLGLHLADAQLRDDFVDDCSGLFLVTYLTNLHLEICNKTR